MKIAIVGSRNLKIMRLGDYLPSEVTEIVSGGARGIDTCAADFARAHGLKLTVFFPDYEAFGRGAPLRRNHDIVKYADAVYAFWDGLSRGTSYTIALAKKYQRPVKVFLLQDDGSYKEHFSTYTLF